MTVDVKLMDTTNKSVIFETRRSGMPMRKIGEKIGWPYGREVSGKNLLYRENT